MAEVRMRTYFFVPEVLKGLEHAARALTEKHGGPWTEEHIVRYFIKQGLERMRIEVGENAWDDLPLEKPAKPQPPPRKQKPTEPPPGSPPGRSAKPKKK